MSMDAIDLALQSILDGTAPPTEAHEGDLLVSEPAAEPTEPDEAPEAPYRTGPVLSCQQAQGDVLIIPRDTYAFPHHADQALPHDHIVTLIADGNGHRLRVDLTLGGQVRYVRDSKATPIDLGVLEVTGRAVVLVEQVGGGDPHGSLYIGAGAYRIRRQWEAVQGPYWPGYVKAKARRIWRRYTTKGSN